MGRTTAPQFALLQERLRRDALRGDARAILAQFDFVFVMERLQESLECFCMSHGVRLCSAERPLRKLNNRDDLSFVAIVLRRFESLIRTCPPASKWCC